MKVDWNELVAGIRIITLRDFFRQNRDTWTAADLARHLDRSLCNTVPILSEIAHRNWAVKHATKSNAEVYKTTRNGNGLANMRAVPRISRPKADALMAELLQRVESVNARDELAYYVHEVRVFGSYIDKTKADLGDIDLVVDLRWRNVPGRHAEYPLRRAHELGKHLRTIVEQVTFGEREVELILKARNPYVSFHLPRDPVSLGAREEVVYSSGVPDD